MTDPFENHHLPHRSVLIVEDDPFLRGGMRKLLEAEGHAVECAANRQEALHVLRSRPVPWLILLDLMMPRREGFSLRDDLRNSIYAHIPIVILSPDGGLDRYSGVPRASIDSKKIARILEVLRTLSCGFL